MASENKPAIAITDLRRVAGFAVVQAVLDGDDWKHCPPSAGMFEALCEREIKRKYLGIVATDVRAVLEREVETLTLIQGERPEDEAGQEEWDDTLDDAVYDALKNCGKLSANFTGAASVDTRIHDPEELAVLAGKAAEDAWKVATFNADREDPRAYTPRELLDMLDVTRSMVDAYVGAHKAPTAKEKEEYKMVNRQVTLTKLHYAKPLYDGSEDDYKYDLEQAMDSDTILSGGSLEKIGCDASDKQNIADWLAELSYDLDVAVSVIEEDRNALTPTQVAELGGDPSSVQVATVADEEEDEDAELAAMMGTAAAPAPAAAPVVTAGAAPPKATRKSAKDKAATGDDPNVIPAPLLSSLKDTLGEKDEVLATGCGMSRATFNNYVKGKGTFVASDVQFNFLRDMAVKRRDELNAIIAEMGER